MICEILGNMCVVIVRLPGCSNINFEINLIFLIKFFLNEQKVKTKTEISWERKELLRWNKRNSSSLLNHLYWIKQNNILGKWEFDCKATGMQVYTGNSHNCQHETN